MAVSLLGALVARLALDPAQKSQTPLVSSWLAGGWHAGFGSWLNREIDKLSET